MWVKHSKGKDYFQMINLDRINFISIKGSKSDGHYVLADFDNSSNTLWSGTFEDCEAYMEHVFQCIDDSRTIGVLDRINHDR